MPSGPQAALLVLATATTRARIVAPHFRTLLGLSGLDELHEAFGCLSGAPQRCQLDSVRAAVDEEAFIAGTQVVQPCFTVWGLDDAIFRASSVTHGPDFAFPAIAGQGSPLGLSKGVLRRAFEQCEQRGFTDIAQAMLRGDKVIARIEVPVMFDDRHIPAGRPKNTQRMVLAVRRSRRLLEHGVRHLHVYWHSPSLKPGLSPFVGTAADVARLYASVEAYLEGVSRMTRVVFATVSEAAAVFGTARSA